MTCGLLGHGRSARFTNGLDDPLVGLTSRGCGTPLAR
jgi:hypothetical protein